MEKNFIKNIMPDISQAKDSSDCTVVKKCALTGPAV
jgi:hypothetical protein